MVHSEIRPVSPEENRPAEDGHAVRRRVLVVLEPCQDRGDGGLDIGPGLLGLDVGALAELVPELPDHVPDLLVGRDIEGDELGPAPLLGLELLERLLELVPPPGLVLLLHGLGWLLGAHCFMLRISSLI